MADLSVDYSADFGAPPPSGQSRYVTAGGIGVSRTVAPFEPALLADVTRQADRRRGGTFSSGMEDPGRYSRWHMGYVDPCVELAATGREITAAALNERGNVILPAVADALRRAGEQIVPQPATGGPIGRITVRIPDAGGFVPEEERSRLPTVFSAIRQVIELFAGPDEHLGLYGAFGYDLAFQFEPLRLSKDRAESVRAGQAGRQRDLVLHLPDELYVIDRKRETALRYSYEFAFGGRSTAGLDRLTASQAPARRCPLPQMIFRLTPNREPMPGWSSRPRSGSRPATSSRSCRATNSGRGADHLPPSTRRCEGATRRLMSSS